MDGCWKPRRLFFFKYVCIDLRDKLRREREGEKETSIINQLPPVCAPPTGDRTCNLSMYPKIEPSVFQFTGSCSNQLNHTGQGPSYLLKRPVHKLQLAGTHLSLQQRDSGSRGTSDTQGENELHSFRVRAGGTTSTLPTNWTKSEPVTSSTFMNS